MRKLAVALILIVSICSCQRADSEDPKNPTIIKFKRAGGDQPIEETLIVKADGSTIITRRSGGGITTTRGQLTPEVFADLTALLNSNEFKNAEEPEYRGHVPDGISHTIEVANRKIYANGSTGVLAQVVELCQKALAGRL